MLNNIYKYKKPCILHLKMEFLFYLFFAFFFFVFLFILNQYLFVLFKKFRVLLYMCSNVLYKCNIHIIAKKSFNRINIHLIFLFYLQWFVMPFWRQFFWFEEKYVMYIDYLFSTIVYAFSQMFIYFEINYSVIFYTIKKLKIFFFRFSV